MTQPHRPQTRRRIPCCLCGTRRKPRKIKPVRIKTRVRSYTLRLCPTCAPVVFEHAMLWHPLARALRVEHAQG